VQSAAGNRRIAAIAGTLALGISVAPAWADPVRLVALGDSLTQGYGLAQDEGFVPQLQAWLQARGHDVVVINAGVSGDTTAGGLARIDWTLTDPVDAMLVTLGGNDLLRGIDPAASRANLEAILTRLQAAGIPALLAGMPAPGNYGPEFKQEFEAIYPELAARFDVPLVADFLQPITARAEAGESFAELMQSDNIHPNPRGVALVVEHVGPAVVDLLERVARATP
jgi:acyl-CoA thioesterase-1